MTRAIAAAGLLGWLGCAAACSTFLNAGAPSPEDDASAPLPSESAPPPPPEAGPPPHDAGSPTGDAGSDARPSPTATHPAFSLRFELNLPCAADATAALCTRNDGTFGRWAGYDGVAASRLGPPTGMFGPRGSALFASLGGAPGTHAVDLDGAGLAIPPGVAITAFTVAAWVRRVATVGADRELARIVSLSDPNDVPLFELGYNKDSETKLQVSVGGALSPGKMTAARDLLPLDTWVFVAMTYDDMAPKEACFYTGSELAEVALVECVDYNTRSFRSADARLSVGNAAAEAARTSEKSAMFPGDIDNVAVYLGVALDLTELAKLQRD